MFPYLMFKYQISRIQKNAHWILLSNAAPLTQDCAKFYFSIVFFCSLLSTYAQILCCWREIYDFLRLPFSSGDHFFFNCCHCFAFSLHWSLWRIFLYSYCLEVSQWCSTCYFNIWYFCIFCSLYILVFFNLKIYAFLHF